MRAGAPLHVLFIHQNFPGQFRRVALALKSDPAFAVSAIGRENCPGLPEITVNRYRLHRSVSQQTHHYARTYENAILHGQAVLRLLVDMKRQGKTPDVIVAHPGWGETLFVRDVFPNVRLVHFCEFYYHGTGADVGFDPAFPTSLDDQARIRSRNAALLLSLEMCDVAVAPTHWQKQLHPSAYHDKIEVLHEGVDTETLYPDDGATFLLADGTVLRPGDQVVTYVARNLEPYRGFHTFMRSLPALLERHPECKVVIAGGNGVGYGKRPKDASDWKTQMLREVRIDPKRVHFTGTLAFADYRRLLQVSAAHVYLTYPFVLSWSMVEAMACGCVVLGSDTAPVREVIRNGQNGLLVDFFDHSALADGLGNVLAHASAYAGMREHARKTTISNYCAKSGTDRYRALITEKIRERHSYSCF